MIPSLIKCIKAIYLGFSFPRLSHILFGGFALMGIFCPLLSQAKEASWGTEELLKRIDRAIERKTMLRTRYEAKLQNLKSKANQETGKERIQTYQQIFRAYAHFQSDSALAYLNRIEESADLLDKPSSLRQWITIGRAEVYGIMGLYKSAATLLEQVHIQAEDKFLRLYYYQVARSVYGWMADYGEVGENRKVLQQLTANYRDSILLVETNATNRAIVQADKLLNEGALQAGKELCLRTLSHADSLQHVYLFALLADLSEASNNHDDYLHYLSLAALSDLERGVTEYRALQQLAAELSERGDVSRAYTYLLCAMDDANFCKARLRSFEATNVFPIINGAHKEQLQTRQTITSVIVVFSVVIVLLLSAFIVLLRKKMRQLSHARQELTEALVAVREVNAALLEMNEKLSTADKVKETYIARYLQRCRGYIDTLDEYRRELLKLAKAKNYAHLMERLQSAEQLVQEEQSFYADFDEAFVTLFPKFIDNFNALLPEQAQVHPKRDEILNTELRIFALIRLGVTDSNRIAHFLNYSVPTIYSYRSRLRNKSLLDKNAFDEAVLSC